MSAATALAEPLRPCVQPRACVPEFDSEQRRDWPAIGHPADLGCLPGGAALSRVAKSQGSEERWASNDGSRRSEEHTSELQSLMRISYAVFCLKKKTE